MRIVAVSDLHLDVQCRTALLRQAESADLMVVAGDFAQRREGLAEYVAPFADFSDKAVFVAGNNESVTDLRAATPVPVLHGETLEIGGLRLAGLGGAVPPLPPLPWVSYDLTEAEAEGLLAGITAADILISHSPPHGVCDWHGQIGALGSRAVYAAAARLQPRWLLCGHVHDSWGARGQIGATQVANLGPVPVMLEVTQ